MLPQSRFLPPDLLPPAPQDAPAACKILAHECLAIRKLIDHDYPTRRALEEGDPSVYTGAAGIAYMYWRLATMDSHYIPGQRAELLERATHYSSASLRLVRPERQGRKRVSTFLTGAAGVYCVSAAIAHAKNDTSAAAAQCRAVLNLASTCVTPEVPSELLYGRAGFLSCLLFLAANAGLHLEECTDVIAGAVQLILADGQQLADDNFPLMWEWHGSNYLGAAHGLAGILTVLLHLRKVVEALGGDGLLRGAVDALLRVRYPSGNLPSSTGSRQRPRSPRSSGAACFGPAAPAPRPPAPSDPHPPAESTTSLSTGATARRASSRSSVPRMRRTGTRSTLTRRARLRMSSRRGVCCAKASASAMVSGETALHSFA